MASLPRFEQLILASSSQYRKQLLEAAGISFRVEKPDDGEDEILDQEPKTLALKRAHWKAQHIAQKFPLALVVGCDQVASFHNKPLSKVSTKQQAQERLTQFANDTHFLHSAYVLGYCPKGEAKFQLISNHVVTIKMQMKALTANEIKQYIDTGEWQNSVGCYQYENKGKYLFEYVDGGELPDIVGLPVGYLVKDLEKLGFIN